MLGGTQHTSGGGTAKHYTRSTTLVLAQRPRRVAALRCVRQGGGGVDGGGQVHCLSLQCFVHRFSSTSTHQQPHLNIHTHTSNTLRPAAHAKGGTDDLSAVLGQTTVQLGVNMAAVAVPVEGPSGAPAGGPAGEGVEAGGLGGRAHSDDLIAGGSPMYVVAGV